MSVHQLFCMTVVVNVSAVLQKDMHIITSSPIISAHLGRGALPGIVARLRDLQMSPLGALWQLPCQETHSRLRSLLARPIAPIHARNCPIK